MYIGQNIKINKAEMWGELAMLILSEVIQQKQEMCLKKGADLQHCSCQIT